MISVIYREFLLRKKKNWESFIGGIVLLILNRIFKQQLFSTFFYHIFTKQNKVKNEQIRPLMGEWTLLRLEDHNTWSISVYHRCLKISFSMKKKLGTSQRFAIVFFETDWRQSWPAGKSPIQLGVTKKKKLLSQVSWSRQDWNARPHDLILGVVADGSKEVA